jgi:hypothetical protein
MRLIKIIIIWFEAHFTNVHYWKLVDENGRIGTIYYSKEDMKRLEGGLFKYKGKIDYKNII